MKDISSSATPTRRRTDGFYRFLRPGALAQIRNSKIIARSHRHGSLIQFPTRLLDSSPAGQTTGVAQVAYQDQIPQILLGKICGGPHSLRRKKLVAAKSVYALNLDPTSSPVLESASTDSFINVLNNDALVAH